MADESLEDNYVFQCPHLHMFHNRTGGPLAKPSTWSRAVLHQGSSVAKCEMEDGEITNLVQLQPPQHSRAIEKELPLAV